MDKELFTWKVVRGNTAGVSGRTATIPSSVFRRIWDAEAHPPPPSGMPIRAPVPSYYSPQSSVTETQVALRGVTMGRMGPISLNTRSMLAHNECNRW